MHKIMVVAEEAAEYGRSIYWNKNEVNDEVNEWEKQAGEQTRATAKAFFRILHMAQLAWNRFSNN